MIFTLDNIVNSIAGVLSQHYPELPIYSNPNQQGTQPPCFFVFFMPSKTENQVGRRFMRNIGIDIVYLTERNITDAYDVLISTAETLDQALEFIPYTDGEQAGNLRTFDREWKIDDGELHYQFWIKAIVSYPDYSPGMEGMEEVKGGIKNAR